MDVKSSLDFRAIRDDISSLRLSEGLDFSLCFLLCLAEIGFKRGNKTSCGLLKKNLLSVNNSIVHTSTVWNGCLQDHLNKNRRNLQLLMIEKKIDDILQHWRSRIGLEKKQVVSSTCFPSLA